MGGSAHHRRISTLHGTCASSGKLTACRHALPVY